MPDTVEIPLHRTLIRIFEMRRLLLTEAADKYLRDIAISVSEAPAEPWSLEPERLIDKINEIYDLRLTGGLEGWTQNFDVELSDVIAGYGLFLREQDIVAA